MVIFPAALLMRLPAPECLSLLHKLLHLALSSTSNVQRCVEAGALPRVLWLLRCVLGGVWTDAWGDGDDSGGGACAD